MPEHPDTDIDQPDILLLSERFERIQDRMAVASARAGRDPDCATLVAVTKTFPVSFVEAAIQLGHRHFGENRAQELIEKASRVPGKVQGGDIEWHMIGHVQRNKARIVVEAADLVHGLDSLRLAEALNGRAAAMERVLPCLIQVNTSGEGSKAGVEPDAAEDLVAHLEPFSNLKVMGLMTIARPVEDPELVRGEFRLLRRLAERLDRQVGHVEMCYLSMGMSGDFEVAIEEGATHVRIGTALFGLREPHI